MSRWVISESLTFQRFWLLRCQQIFFFPFSSSSSSSSLLSFSFVLENYDKTHNESRPARIPGESSARAALPSLPLWHRGLRARPSTCWRHLHLCALQQARRCRVIGLPAPFSPWHIMRMKVPEGLNDHIHLNRAPSHVVVENSPNQQRSLWLQQPRWPRCLSLALWTDK